MLKKYYSIFLLKFNTETKIMWSRRSPELFMEDKLPVDIYITDSISQDRFALEQICCGLLQTIVDKNIRARRFILREHDQHSYRHD